MNLAQTRHKAPCKVTILLILRQTWLKLAREVNSDIASLIGLPLAQRGYHVGQRATSPRCFANSCFHVLQSEIYIVMCVRTQNIGGKIYVQTVNKMMGSKSRYQPDIPGDQQAKAWSDPGLKRIVSCDETWSKLQPEYDL
jgi:hypothetical protein